MLTITQAQTLVRQYYGEELTPSQAHIFAAVFDMNTPLVSVLGATQIKKSRATAFAAGLLASMGVPVAIVGPKEEQATTPLQYFTERMDFNSWFANNMLQGGEDKIARLKARESKSFISFLSGGFLRSITLNQGNSKQKKTSNLGKGAMVVIVEEASLLDNETMALAERMVAGFGRQGRIIKLGNAISKEKHCDHFYRSTLGENGYYNITVNYEDALREGIYTQAFIDRVKDSPFFDSLYGCIFPELSTYLPNGYKRLFKLETIIEACKPFEAPEGRVFTPNIIAIDIGEGSPDPTVISGMDETMNAISAMFETKNPDVMAQIGEYLPIIEPYKKTAVFRIDNNGVGSGPYQRLKELGFAVQGIKAGEASPVPGYENVKAYGFWQGEKWLREGGHLLKGDWQELAEVATKTTSEKKEKIESKEELADRHVPSYNYADTFMMMFAKKRGSYNSGQMSAG